MNSKSSERGGSQAPKDSKVIPIEQSDHFMVAAIGASAGGIEAMITPVRQLAADTRMAFVVVQHLDPKYHSILSELLARETSMKSTEVQDGMHRKSRAPGTPLAFILADRYCSLL